MEETPRHATCLKSGLRDTAAPSLQSPPHLSIITRLLLVALVDRRRRCRPLRQGLCRGVRSCANARRLAPVYRAEVVVQHGDREHKNRAHIHPAPQLVLCQHCAREREETTPPARLLSGKVAPAPARGRPAGVLARRRHCRAPGEEPREPGCRAEHERGGAVRQSDAPARRGGTLPLLPRVLLLERARLLTSLRGAARRAHTRSFSRPLPLAIRSST